jgi:hypothetical protein
MYVGRGSTAFFFKRLGFCLHLLFRGRFLFLFFLDAFAFLYSPPPAPACKNQNTPAPPAASLERQPPNHPRAPARCGGTGVLGASPLPAICIVPLSASPPNGALTSKAQPPHSKECRGGSQVPVLRLLPLASGLPCIGCSPHTGSPPHIGCPCPPPIGCPCSWRLQF